MPGLSVSACHLCHLHSHNHDNLIRTSPLRHSKGKSKSSKYRHHHGHSNSGYSSREEGGERVGRSNSASALARLTEHSHSLPGSRSNSLSRYHREVSILPDGGDTYNGVGIRHSTSTRSLDLNPPLTSLLDTRTTSLPRVSTLHSHPQIHVQPDILVNAMPRSRANSRSGSLSRNTVALSQDNSHDYYLDMHRQRFKEEKRKHRFNLQTVMLIGCYTLLIMIAIVVGVVLCYQNGWFGLGPPQEKISGDWPTADDSNAVGRNSIDMKNRRIHPDKNANIAGNEIRTRPRNSADGSLDFDNTSVNNNKHLHSAGLFPTIAHNQNPQQNVNNLGRQRNPPGHVPSQNADQNRAQVKFSEGNDNNRNVPGESHRDNHGQFNHKFETISNDRNIPNDGNNPNVRQGNVPHDSVGHPLKPPLVPQNPRVHGTFKTQSPSQWPEHGPAHRPNNQVSGHAHQPNNRHLIINSQHPSHAPQPSNAVPSHAIRPINPVNSLNINPSAGLNLRTGIPLNTNSGLTFTPGFNTNLNPTQNRNQAHLSPGENTPPLQPLQQGNIDANTIAKTLFQGNLRTSQGQGPTATFSNSNINHRIPTSNKNFSTQSVTEDSLASSIANRILSGDTSSLTTQELLDLLAIRRMRDLLNSKGNTKTIFDMLRNVEPSANTRLETIREEKLTPSDLRDGIENNQERARGNGRNIKGSINIHPNFHIHELIEALGGHTRIGEGETSEKRTLKASGNPRTDEEVRESTLKHLINRTINGAIIRLINSRVDELRKGNIDPNLSFNVSGISVFPVNSEDLKILLESTPTSIHENIGNLSKERIRSLQILQRLIELNDRKQTIERHVDSSSLTSQNAGSGNLQADPLRKASSREIGMSTVSRIGDPIPEARISDPPNPSATNTIRTHSETFPPQTSLGVQIRNVTSTFNRGETAIRNAATTQPPITADPASLRKPTAAQPDPSFALMVRTHGQGNAPRNNFPKGNDPVFPPPFISSRRNSRARTRSVAAHVPIKEQVVLQPGREKRGRSEASLVRAWTHMDSKGTLSKGRVHSDGSFTFTNCRPVEVCNEDESPRTIEETNKN